MEYTCYSTEYLYDFYASGLTLENDLESLYFELLNRGETDNPLLNEIRERVVHIVARSLDHVNTNNDKQQSGEPSTSYSQPVPHEIQNERDAKNIQVRDGKSDNLKYLNIESMRTRDYKRFKVTGNQIIFRFKNPDDSNPLRFVERGFSELLNVGMEDVDPEDFVGFTLASENSPDRPIGVSFRKRSRLTVEAVMQVITSVHQSNASFFMGEKLSLHLHKVQLPKGSARNPHVSRLEHHEFVAAKKSILAVKVDNNLCLAGALVLAIAFREKSPNLRAMQAGCPILTEKALELCAKCNVDLSNGGSYEHIEVFQRHLVNYTIVVYDNREGISTYFEGPRSTDRVVLNLLLDSNHYDVIKSLTGAFSCSYFCELCKAKYSNKNRRHNKCPYKCPCCHMSPQCETVRDLIQCNKCGRDFRGAACFSEHEKSLCSNLRRCTTCLESYWTKAKNQHECGVKYCKTCYQTLPVQHLCYMQPNKLTEKLEKKRGDFLFIFYDIESRQETELTTRVGYLHEVNLLVAQQACGTCINNHDLEQPCDNCGARQHIFKGSNSVEEFLNYISKIISLGKFTITALAHNMKSYDGCFILKGILADVGRWNPKIIRTGAKIISIKCGERLRFIDSLNYIPIALAKLPETFKFEGMKGYFPYLFNTNDHQNYVGPMPNLEFYGYKNMQSGDRVKFLKWYKDQISKNTIFNMDHELVTYCIGDVDILRKACIIFRECFLTTNNVDPFLEATTIASACNLVFRRNFLQPRTIGIMSKGGYRLANNQSSIALKWLYWTAHSLNINISHAGNGHEVKLKEGIMVDGFCEENNTVYQFHGCYYHGCTKCYPIQTEIVDGNDKDSMIFLRREKSEAIGKRILQAGYALIIKWECDFRNEIETDINLKNFLTTNSDLFKKNPLHPRDSFFGGRTNAVKLYHKTDADEKICYLDVCSLYPYVNKYGKYPTGHPKITVGHNFCKEINLETVEGIIKCTVLPPQDLYHPVLPYRCDGKLTFPLCRVCVENQNQDNCTHTDEERKLTGTFVADELRKAIEKKYRVLEIHEIWEYDIEQYNVNTKTGGLFAGYVNNFLKQKVENSGWPSGVTTDAERHQYVDSYLEREGVALDAENITYNAGLRYISKLMLNSFWGKFGQRENMMQSSLIYKPRELFKLLVDPSVTVHDMVIFDDTVMLVTWDRVSDDITPLGTVSVPIATYTTATARLELYKYLERLDRRVLYFDTDSVIFTQKPGEWMPPTGEFLGQLTDEILEYGPDSYITEFVSGGPKNYAFNIYCPSRKCDCNSKCLNSCSNDICLGECNVSLECSGGCKNITKCKVKGITLNYQNSKIVNFETIRELVCNPTSRTTVSVHNDRKIVRTPAYDVISRPEDKIYRVNYTKRRRIENSYDTYPYGFRI